MVSDGERPRRAGRGATSTGDEPAPPNQLTSKSNTPFFASALRSKKLATDAPGVGDPAGEAAGEVEGDIGLGEGCRLKWGVEAKGRVERWSEGEGGRAGKGDAAGRGARGVADKT